MGFPTHLGRIIEACFVVGIMIDGMLLPSLDHLGLESWTTSLAVLVFLPGFPGGDESGRRVDLDADNFRSKLWTLVPHTFESALIVPGIAIDYCRGVLGSRVSLCD